ncbi:D-3-phosphoglycerate dehydrogenase SerA [Paenibacillus larvae subsp. larvae]|uniref:D-3-phosphoglycerate dehydrogenase SerA n=1 Tax=Paenibacillus larvae subsp. larvae TaxID=147375 RepID=A0A2L1UB10_9BACL|nr:2-hydroxyacid dehydrogenase [Paenibacillus larvae]AQT85901.1 lactate dehydrogenase [Paenibacillus larvae subsp. pulvifaciens]AQZ45862.1 lactate dehydrogenase [Paenibacillus larvae subsp. pulvifaciens]AVF25340.1 D-3-phosphoglycerate dehydrogenase SerA [Paenibacillus larvae subsp. larvae]AVF30117.1 D-3-phosphoglycerate dehydrogenase SerA [Paenibacillus larvae subsp. larvae]MBH0343737.1 lactate dehydrogenase [Paenibacillus larvae]
MSLKIACYGVRDNEVPFFEKLNKYDFQLSLFSELLNHSNIETAQGMDAVLLRGNCIADRKNIQKMHEYGIKYVFTRTVGFNHIDLQAAADYDMQVARVPFYSPNAIAELSLTLALSLLRHTAHTTIRTANKDFRVDEVMFSKEVRNCTVGIIGTGKIGFTEAQLFKGLGARVLGYDIFQSDAAKEILTYVELDELLEQSDIVSLHVPYFPGQNDKMVNAEFLAKMKDGSIFINTARGELHDNKAILEALQSGKLEGFATDVFANERDIFFRKFDDCSCQKLDPTVHALIDLYPRVLVTPHIGSNTDEALTNMIETSFQNFHDIMISGHTLNAIELPPKSN